MRDVLLSTVVMGIHRGLLLRNRLLGLGPPAATGRGTTAEVERCRIPSGGRMLEGRMVRPRGMPVRAAVLVLHGIGETVEHWEAVQGIFAAEGVASLVVDYRGFGRTGGWFSTARAEVDAVAGARFLREWVAGVRMGVVGFSLGSGAAAAVAEKVGADLLVVCAGYGSLRGAARSAGLPAWTTRLMRDVWRTEEVLGGRRAVPVLVVHGAEDRLFPCGMAREMGARLAGCEVVVVPGCTHDDPVFRPSLGFWGVVLRGIRGLETDGRAAAEGDG